MALRIRKMENGKWSDVRSLENCNNVTIIILNEKIYIIGNEPSFKSYDPITDSFTSLKPCRVHTKGVAIAFENSIYIFGGEDFCRYLSNSVERYDSVKNEWILCNKMPQVRNKFTAVAFKNKIYIIGGYVFSLSRDQYVHVNI